MRWGIDLGGTKVEILGLDEHGQEVFRRRVATPRDSYSAIVDTIADLVGDAETSIGRRGSVGIGTPGAVSPATGLMKNANTTTLNGKPLAEDLKVALGREIWLANDANCFALSEAVDGAARHAETVFGVILGTGTGAGVVLDRKVLSGRHAIAGEWGHNPLPWMTPAEFPGHPCWCGQSGCLETYLSGPAFEADYERHAGERLNAAAIAARKDEDPVAAATLERYLDRLARGLASIINVLDPDAIVLGGGLSNLEILYTEVPRRWGRYVFSDVVSTELVPPAHGDSSGVRGAAWLPPG